MYLVYTRMSGDSYRSDSDSLTVTLTWHASECKVYELHQRYIISLVTLYLFARQVRVTVGDSGLFLLCFYDVLVVVQEGLLYHGEISDGCCCVPSRHVTSRHITLVVTLLFVQEALHYHGEISAGCCCVTSCHVTSPQVTLTVTLLFAQEALHYHGEISAGCCYALSRHVTSRHVTLTVTLPFVQEALDYHGEISAGCCCVPSGRFSGV